MSGNWMTSGKMAVQLDSFNFVTSLTKEYWPWYFLRRSQNNYVKVNKNSINKVMKNKKINSAFIEISRLYEQLFMRPSDSDYFDNVVTVDNRQICCLWKICFTFLIFKSSECSCWSWIYHVKMVIYTVLFIIQGNQVHNSLSLPILQNVCTLKTWLFEFCNALRQIFMNLVMF